MVHPGISEATGPPPTRWIRWRVARWVGLRQSAVVQTDTRSARAQQSRCKDGGVGDWRSLYQLEEDTRVKLARSTENTTCPLLANPQRTWGVPIASREVGFRSTVPSHVSSRTEDLGLSLARAAIDIEHGKGTCDRRLSTWDVAGARIAYAKWPKRLGEGVRLSNGRPTRIVADAEDQSMRYNGIRSHEW